MMPANRQVELAMRFERNRLLNVWLREFEPQLFDQLCANHQVEIPVQAGRILVGCDCFSPSGFHLFGEVLLIDGEGIVRPIDEICDLANLLLSSRNTASKELLADILHRIKQSSKASIEHAVFSAEKNPGVSAVELEQSLWFGHPFHPLAKSVGGFNKEDAERFAPERAARFQLHWLIVNRSLVAEFKQNTQERIDLEQRLLDASGIPSDAVGDNSLFPCHPWQVPLLRSDPSLARWLEDGVIKLTDASGDFAIPTSSVRTVWFPERRLFVKLPIEARITNFPRVNTDEQIARSIAGSKATSYAQAAVAQAGFSILAEPVGRILNTGLSIGDGRFYPNTGFLLRDADFGNGPLPLVVAGLLETNPATGKANLAAICAHRLRQRDEVEHWLRDYTLVTLIPLLRLFSTTGIALEAHTQNSLVRFIDGWPTHLYVRDLEGIAVDRNAFERGFGAQAEALDEALFYDRDTAWRRLLYYVVVNHYANVVATIAAVSGMDEADLWDVAAKTLSAFPEIPEVSDLLNAATLPAKANFKSSLAGHADMPSYVPIPNPFQSGNAKSKLIQPSRQSSVVEAVS